MDSNRLVGFRSVKIVGGFILGRGDVVEGAVEPDGVEPTDPGECGELDVVDGSPRSLLSDELGLVETVDGLS